MEKADKRQKEGLKKIGMEPMDVKKILFPGVFCLSI